MLDNKLVLAGLAAVAGLVVGILIGGGISESRVRDAVADAMGEARGAAQEMETRRDAAMAAIEERMTALETAVSDSAGTATESGDAMAAMQERMAAIEEAVSNSAGAASETAESLRAQLADLGASVEERLGEAVDQVAALASGAGMMAGGGAADEGDQAAEPSSPEGLSAGDTAVLANGGVRVFVSRVDDDGGAARLSVNGELVSLAVGESVTVEAEEGPCDIVLDAVDRGHAIVSGDCGGSGATSAASAAGTDLPTEEVRAGNIVTLADGKIRVFLSGVTGAGAARIAVNGVETVEVEAGARVDVEAADGTPCQVIVSEIGDGVVSLAGTCG